MNKPTRNHTKGDQQTVIGIDLGDIKHAICVTDKDGKILKEDTVLNTHDGLEELADLYPNSLVAMETGTHSPWISRFFTAKGAKVLVANARKLRAIYQNDRKSDALDARMLAKLARLDPDLLHPIEHISEEAQRDQLAIKLRDSLVRQRVNIMASVRSTLKSLGIRFRSSCSPCFSQYARHALEEHPEILPAIEPSLDVIDLLTAKIKHYDKAIARRAKEHYPITDKLQQIAGIGPITALCFVLTVENPKRFANPRDVGAFLGLVPRRDQSGQSDKQLPISKAGNRYLRTLLVQAAQYILGHFGPDCDLRRYGMKIAARGGKAAKKRAVIAVARKLSVLMLILWQSQSDYEPLHNLKLAA